MDRQSEGTTEIPSRSLSASGRRSTSCSTLRLHYSCRSVGSSSLSRLGEAEVDQLTGVSGARGHGSVWVQPANAGRGVASLPAGGWEDREGSSDLRLPEVNQQRSCRSIRAGRPLGHPGQGQGLPSALQGQGGLRLEVGHRGPPRQPPRSVSLPEQRRGRAELELAGPRLGLPRPCASLSQVVLWTRSLGANLDPVTLVLRALCVSSEMHGAFSFDTITAVVG